MSRKFLHVLRLIELIGECPDASTADLYGLFYDKKDVHYQVSKVRRDQCASALLSAGMVKVPGVICEPCEELVALRASLMARSSAAVGLEVCSLAMDASGERLLVPDQATLPFTVEGSLKQRMDELAVEFGLASPKRRRHNVAEAQEGCMFAKLSMTATKVSDSPVDLEKSPLRLLRMRPRPCLAPEDAPVEQPEDGSADRPEGGSAGAPESCSHEPLYLYNPSSARVLIPPRTRILPVCSGKMFDHKATGQELHDEGVVVWPWTLGFAGPESGIPHLCMLLLTEFGGGGQWGASGGSGRNLGRQRPPKHFVASQYVNVFAQAEVFVHLRL